MVRRFPCYISKARGAVFELAEGTCFHSSRAQLTAASSLSSCSSWPEQLQVREAKLRLLRGKGEVQRAAQGSPWPAWSREMGWGRAQPLLALSSSTGSSRDPEADLKKGDINVMLGVGKVLQSLLSELFQKVHH